MAATRLEDLFLLTLKDIYHGEKQNVPFAAPPSS